MMSRGRESQAGELIEQTRDVVHAAKLNLETIGLLLSCLPNAPLQTEAAYLKGLLESLDQLLQTRPEHHLDYLITRQIQEEEENVRRERLTDYEEKIYDQRRIVADKQAFFESLLRPKKKRAAHQTMEEFQEIRTREKEAEERQKAEVLGREHQELRELRRSMEVGLANAVEKKGVSDSTAVSVPEGVPSENTIPIEVKRPRTFSRSSRPSHSRTSSLQSSFARESSNSRGKEPPKEDRRKELQRLTEEVGRVREETEEVAQMHGQQTDVLRFKQARAKDLRGQYQRGQEQLKAARKELDQVRRTSRWREEQWGEPVRQRRQGSVGHSDI